MTEGMNHTCSWDVLPRLHMLVAADSQAQGLGLVVLDESEGVLDVGVGRHDDQTEEIQTDDVSGCWRLIQY